MKAHLAKLSLALLSTVFLLGCQEQGSGPVGPEGLGPQFTHKTSSQLYDITFAGDITTDPETASGSGKVGGQVGFDACCGGGELILTSALLVDVGGAADKCFGEISIVDDWRGRLVPDKKAMNQVEAVFLFDANDRDGNPGVRYRLILAPGTAVGDVGAVFPPEPGKSMTVTYSDTFTFKINAQRKKEKNACSSDGFIRLKNAISVVVDNKT